jgi:hypothetical protein
MERDIEAQVSWRQAEKVRKCPVNRHEVRGEILRRWYAGELWFVLSEQREHCGDPAACMIPDNPLRTPHPTNNSDVYPLLQQHRSLLLRAGQVSLETLHLFFI